MQPGNTHDIDAAPVMIERGDSTVAIQPETASIMAFSVAGHDVLRPGTSALVPLAPWCHDVRNSRFSFESRVVRLSPASATSLRDGQLTRAAWQAIERTARSVTLESTPDLDGWPWDYRVRVSFDIDNGRLDVTTAIVNQSDQPMPVGLGFALALERPVRVSAVVDGHWDGGADGWPDRWEPDEALRNAAVDRLDTDRTYTGWDGRAILDITGLRVNVATGLKMLHLRTRRGSGVVEFRPVAMAPDGFNHTGRGGQTVAPDGESEARLRLSARPS